MTKERWKDVPGWEGLYQVSDQGRVRRVKTGRILRTPLNGTGYPSANLYLRGRRCGVVVHRLLLLAFVGPCPEGKEACHNNGRKDDNRLANLRWDTRSANMLDAVDHGHRGSGRAFSKLTEAGVRDLRRRHARGESFRAIARLSGVSYPAARNAVLGITWKHVKEAA